MKMKPNYVKYGFWMYFISHFGNTVVKVNVWMRYTLKKIPLEMDRQHAKNERDRISEHMFEWYHGYSIREWYQRPQSLVILTSYEV